MREFLQMARRLAPSCGTARERIVLSAWHALAIAALSLCVFLLLRPLLYPGSGDEHHGQAVMLAITALVIETVSTVSAHRQIKAREQLISTAHEARVRTDELFAMTDMLQSADCHEDAAAVLMTSSAAPARFRQRALCLQQLARPAGSHPALEHRRQQYPAGIGIAIELLGAEARKVPHQRPAIDHPVLRTPPRSRLFHHRDPDDGTRLGLWAAGLRA